MRHQITVPEGPSGGLRGRADPGGGPLVGAPPLGCPLLRLHPEANNRSRASRSSCGPLPISPQRIPKHILNIKCISLVLWLSLEGISETQDNAPITLGFAGCRAPTQLIPGSHLDPFAAAPPDRETGRVLPLDVLETARPCLCLVFPLASWLRHCLCLAFPPSLWLRQHPLPCGLPGRSA